jgi:ABC-type polysaccharide/polyol phosphate export permease
MFTSSRDGWSDLLQTVKMLPLSLYFAWGDTRARYRRSVLGPLWLVLGTAVGVVGLGFLWSELLHVDKATFIPSLSIGLVVWQLLSGCILEASNIYIQNAKLIRNLRTPLLVFPVQLLLRQLINFGHNLLVVFVVLLIFPPPLSLTQLLLIPGLLIVVGNLFWISTLIGLLGARFRDLGPLVGSFMPLMFFLTPVIYRPKQLAMSEFIAWLNPLTYLVSLVRDPVLGVAPPLFVYSVGICLLALGGSLTLWIVDRKYGRVAFWV